ncbi:beta-lactamase/transpeptidase-like protein [Mycena vulgaris]|nr:beta-lactamase/transpeptidase-like protein [Mycena vulgaris]
MHFLLRFIALATAAGSVSLVCSTPATVAQQQPFDSHTNNILNPDIDGAIESILKSFKSPGGVGVAVVRKDDQGSGWRVETKGYGIAKVDGTKVTPDTLFAIGSNSKASLLLFNILATGLLISNESFSTRISWDTKIASVVPEWGLIDPIASAESTIRDVMSHRTGLPRHAFISPPASVSDTIRRLRYLRPSTGFRERYQYSNHMYTLLSYFPPLLVGIPFEKYVNAFIIEPLGMRSTTYYSDRAEASGHLADGMMRDGVNKTEDVFGVGRVRALPYWAPSKADTGDGIDGRHPVENTTIIPAEVIRQVAAGVTVALPAASFPELSPIVYGGAQWRGSYRGFEVVQHGGVTPGFNSQVIRFPLQNFGVAILSNDESFGALLVETIKFRIIDEVLKLEPVDWTARLKSLATSEFSHGPTPTPRPANATLTSFPFSSLAGTYQDPGYGTLELCLVSPEDESSASKSCRELLGEIPTVLPDSLDLQIPTFLAK